MAIDIETTGLRRDDPSNMDTLLSVGLVVDDLADQKPIEELPKCHILVDVVYETLSGNIQAFCMNSKLLSEISAMNAAKVKHTQHYTPGIIDHFAFGNAVARIISEFASATGLRPNTRDSITVAGKNVVDFDVRFLNNAVGLEQYLRIRRRALDPAILFTRPDDTEVPSLSECKKRAGLSPEVSHVALNDALDIVQLLRIGFNQIIKR